MKKSNSLIVLLLTITATLFSQNNPLINTPRLNSNGTKIAFNYQGDIWTVSTNGQNLNRLTIHEGYDANPFWSTDGKTIAFQSDRFGNNDIYTIPTIGGVPTRITYHSAADVVTDFTSNNTILFTTSRNFKQVEWDSEIHSVSANGGTPFRLLNAFGSDATLSPNGKLIAFTIGSCRIDREAYQGPANRDVWVYNIEQDSYNQLTTFNGQDLAPQWADDTTILFQSARSGIYNIHQMAVDANGNKSGEISQISNLKKLGLFSYDLSANGNSIILVSGDEVSMINRKTKAITAINITIHSDYRFDPKERKTFTNKATEIVVSPNGKFSAFVVRGEVFITENDKEKNKTVNLSNSSSRDIDVSWLNDDTLLFISDRNGTYNLYSTTSSDSENKNIFTSLKHNITQLTKSKNGITNPVISPDKKQIAYKEGNGKLIVAAISETGKISNIKTLVDGWNAPESVAWSPDSKWLAYSLSDLYFNDEIYIHKADDSKKAVNISMHPKGDYSPVWSKDGNKLGFTSDRNNGDFDVWFVWLNKKDWEKTKEDWDEDSEESEDKKEDKDKKEDDSEDDKIADITIDFEDIYNRQVQVTSYTGGEFLETFSKDGKTIYYSTDSGSNGNQDLFQINWDGEDEKPLTTENASPKNISLNAKGDFIYYVGKGKLARIKLKGAKKESLPFSAKMIVDYNAESNQIFEEAWKVIEERFYDPNYHGKNWESLKKTYKPLALKASTRTDFKAIFNKMLGQINASHMGIYRGENRADTQKETTGILGVEFDSSSKSSLKISSIVRNSSADREVSKLKVGDKILKINGVEVSPSENIYKHLTATANEKIVLSINRNGVEKEVIIRPKKSARTDNYNAWVKERKILTEKYSGGRLGYIHIQGMNWTSFEEFERELTAAGFGKEGIVIDVRYNGGGWTTDYLMAVLNVQQHAYTIPRGAAKDLEKENKNFTQYYPFS
ncbi:MAG: PDZ domain-containing protein, partial [Flavobacteriaceae bacterium]